MEDRSSFTADTVALQRAFESARPPGQRLFSDPYAVELLRPALRVLAAPARVRLLRWLAVGPYDTLAGPGPRPSAVPAVFVWEGVTNYLTREAVAATLETVHDRAAAGSRLVLTYVDRRALSEPSPFPKARRWVRGVARAGEPWTFGLLSEEASAFFAEHGLRVRVDTSTYDVGRAWFNGGRERGSRLYRIAVTDVVGAPAAR
jgi:O-methyltransferase involved in polyketide biosynthesis